MWIAPFFMVALFVYLGITAPVKLFIAGPVLLLWGLSPYITWLSSIPAAKKKTLLTAKQNGFLLKMARKTWAFFETFVTAEDNWLPPDNFQQHPVPVIAHRTSPTNIGLSLLANLSALDFGYISVSDFLDRTNKTMQTMHKLTRYRGHFYNWYDTRSLAPLLPTYISTVDSGNLSGHLLTLRQGLFEIIHQKIVRPKTFEGIIDTAYVMQEAMDKNEGLSAFIAVLQSICNEKGTTLDDLNNNLKRLQIAFDTSIHTLAVEPGSMAAWWKDTLAKQVQDAIADMQVFSPWFSLPPVAKKYANIIHIDSAITLGH